ncbi:MAG: hypothetical protein Q8L08_10795 [Candidatus Nanopelagicaceae bacterium]|nr:hypothetical protein [Candidatus Nanopelagicaceae bacterium]
MRISKFLRVKLEIAIFAIGANFISIFLGIRRNLNLVVNAIMHNRGFNGIRSGHITEGSIRSERGDVPGWVLVVLMTTGLVTAIWTIAAPRLSAILRNSLDAMNGIR